jgi:hypothetical protein
MYRIMRELKRARVAEKRINTIARIHSMSFRKRGGHDGLVVVRICIVKDWG